MSRQTRRTFIKVSGALIGGIAAGAGTVTAAESTDRFIVEKRGNRSLDGLDVVFDLDQIGYAVVRASESELKNAKGVKSFAPDLELSFAQPVAEQLDESATDEPFYPLQWDKQALDVPTAHETTRGEGTRVAVIDTGVAANHPDLQHAVNVDLSRNFTEDDYGAGGPFGGYHGTHVAGIIAADDQNELGVVGNAPATEIIDCRVFSPGALASFSSILASILYATELGCDAANLSLGAYPNPRQELGSFYGKVLNSTMTYANKEGTLLVIAAGNDSADLQHDKNFISLPNEGAQAVSVSATGPIGFNWGDEGLESPPESPAFYTNYGTNAITIGAPGGDADLDASENEVPGWYFDLVLSTIAEPVFDDDGNYLGAAYGWGWAAGTSMAAPNVAGAAALVKSANPNYNAGQVESALKRAADVPDGYGKEFYGSGFLNIVDAL